MRIKVFGRHIFIGIKMLSFHKKIRYMAKGTDGSLVNMGKTMSMKLKILISHIIKKARPGGRA